MSKVVEIFNSEASLNKSLSFKVNKETYSLLNKVYKARKENDLSNDFSHFLRQCLMVALLCDDPDNYVPEFKIPNIEELLNEVEASVEIQETEIDSLKKNQEHE